MKKTLILCFSLYCFVPLKAQLSGGVETNAAFYIDDNKIKLEEVEARNRFRSNNYLRLDYQLKKITVGVQFEAYTPKALLNYSPEFKDANIANYYVTYKNEKGLELTAGHFYEQFGSGLVLRNWEDRQLGIANSIAGGLVKYVPAKWATFTVLYGKQRNGLGFKLSGGNIAAANADIDLAHLLTLNKTTFGVGGSVVHRREPTDLGGLSPNTFLTSIRSNFAKAGFTADIEYVFKSADALVEFGNIRPAFLFDGDAYLLNLGYSKKGFGITTNFRRLENFGFYSSRSAMGNTNNERMLNYIPALTKQFDYGLTNIYVYASQPNISFEPDRNKAGEIGGQLDLYYQFKKGTLVGGEYGSNLSLNFSRWHGLAGRYDADQRKYAAKKFVLGEKYYSDASVEWRRKMTKKWTTVFTYLNQYYNARYVEEAVGEVNAHTVVFDNTVQLKKSRSVRWELQHQWAKGGFEEWAAFQAEYNFNPRLSVFMVNLYNYGNKDVNEQMHYYNAGAAYTKGGSRLQVAYGRQRGGLICVGGVCRFVPESAGITFGFNKSF